MTKIIKVIIVLGSYLALDVYFAKKCVNVNVYQVEVKVRVWVRPNYPGRKLVLKLWISKIERHNIQNGWEKVELIRYKGA